MGSFPDCRSARAGTLFGLVVWLVGSSVAFADVQPPLVDPYQFVWDVIQPVWDWLFAIFAVLIIALIPVLLGFRFVRRFLNRSSRIV